jgi:prefoldin subunit 5
MALDPSTVAGGLILSTITALATWRIRSARAEGAQTERDIATGRVLESIRSEIAELSRQVRAVAEIETRCGARQEQVNQNRAEALVQIFGRIDAIDKRVVDVESVKAVVQDRANAISQILTRLDRLEDSSTEAAATLRLLTTYMERKEKT